MLSLVADTINHSVSPRERSTADLIDASARFHRSVLPVGLLRELQSRGDTIHDDLVDTIERAIQVDGEGLGVQVPPAFFAFALLTPIARPDDLPLIETLLTLPDDKLYELLGDLSHEGMSHFILATITDDNKTEVLDRLGRLWKHENFGELDFSVIAHGLVLATADGRLEASTTRNWMLDQLKARQSKVEDLQSAQIVCELMDLGLHRDDFIDAEVRAAFERGQIDHTYVDFDSWERAGDVNPTLDLDKWSDPTEQLEQWCYYFVTDDASPIGATYVPNPKSSGARFWNEKRLLESAFEQIRYSTDERFPLDAFRVAQRSSAGFYEPAIELIRSGMTEYAHNDAGQRLNGAYVGLAWIVSKALPLPIDLLQSILNLPEEERESIFGDQFYLIVHAAALTPAAEYEWVEQWIWDTDRSSMDRLSMVEFYLHACVYGMLSRDDAVDNLVAGLRRAFDEDPLLIGPYAEALAHFGPGDYQELLQTAFERPDVEWFHPIETLDRMSTDAEFGKSEYERRNQETLILENIISSGVVFDDPFKPAQPQNPPPLPSSQSYEPLDEPTVSKGTIRNEVDRVSRNAPCPCGSGKKFKKCCLRK